MKKVTLFFITILLFSSMSFAKEIALSFDDAPRRLTGHFSQMDRAKALVKALKEAGVKDADFFCNSSFINSDTEKVVRYYNDNGFTIGNHTHSHPSLAKQDFATYSKDFLIADTRLKKYSNFKKLFRYPFLREGNTVEKRDQMRKLLKGKGYTNAYITVDFSDWHLEDLFRQSLAKKEKVDLNKLKKLYLSLAKESLEHYDKMAIKHLGRSPKHVMLLHETDIAALFIKDLVVAMKSWGWDVISSAEAYKDPIAQFELKRAMKNNPGRIGEIAMSKGQRQDVWADSTYPKYITDRYKTEVLGLSGKNSP